MRKRATLDEETKSPAPEKSASTWYTAVGLAEMLALPASAALAATAARAQASLTVSALEAMLNWSPVPIALATVKLPK